MEVQKLSQQLIMFGANYKAAKAEPAEKKGESKRAESVKGTVGVVAKTAEKIKNEQMAANAEKVREVEKKSEEQIAKRIVEQVNEYLSENNWSLKYYYHEAAHQMVARIVDNETNEVIREVPPKELLDLSARMEKFVGLILDEQV